MVIKAFSAAIYGIDASIISIEVSIVRGTNFYIVGLPDNVVKESQHRIESVFKHLNYEIPRQRVIINLAPADIRKVGAGYDLPIALSILQASNQVKLIDIEKFIIVGELSLSGEIRSVKGALPISMKAKEQHFKGLLLPRLNANEAAIIDGIDIIPSSHITETIDFFQKKKEIKPLKIIFSDLLKNCYNNCKLDFSDVQGQESTKRALEIAAAGGHNVIMVGAPGSGKTMLAQRIPTILPKLTLDEALETSKIYSSIGKLESVSFGQIIIDRPFRAPHHTISDVALVGGGIVPRPGEISLAHHGILFLDELPEFRRIVLEVMRQPLEEKKVIISRAKFSIEFPASFMLVASMNPCPCGYYNHPSKKCVCDFKAVKRYINRISGPLLDRIDIHLEVCPVSFDSLIKQDQNTESSESIRKRVLSAREIQKSRFVSVNRSIYYNALMPSIMLKNFCKISLSSQLLLKNVMNKFGLSARAYDKILKVARTIADLAESENLKEEHIFEAIQYRSLDREAWGG